MRSLWLLGGIAVLASCSRDGGGAGAQRPSQAGVIHTVATSSGDINGVALAADGTLYFSDTDIHQIRKVDAGGKVFLVAGTGARGFGGDGGQATEAQLNAPSGLAVMADGALLIADSGNNRIRKVGTDGKISTVAGNGKDGSGGDHGPATAAQLSQPGGIVALADGTLFIADTGNNRIRKVGADGKITTVVGKGQEGRAPSPFKQLRNPHGLAALPDGTVFFSNAIDHRIWKMSADGKTLAVAAGSGEVDFSGMGGYGGDGGPATAAQLNLPDGLAVMADGTLFIADHENHRVRKVGTDCVGCVWVGVGNAGFGGDDGPAVAAQLWSPRGVAVAADGTLYIADSVNHRVRRVEGR